MRLAERKKETGGLNRTPVSVGSEKLTSSTLGRDSAMLKQAWHCTRCSLGSVAVPGTVAGAECAGLFDCPDGEIVGRREESCK